MSLTTAAQHLFHQHLHECSSGSCPGRASVGLGWEMLELPGSIDPEALDRFLESLLWSNLSEEGQTVSMRERLSRRRYLAAAACCAPRACSRCTGLGVPSWCRPLGPSSKRYHALLFVYECRSLSSVHGLRSISRQETVPSLAPPLTNRLLVVGTQLHVCLAPYAQVAISR
jgi:hypothetical protein